MEDMMANHSGMPLRGAPPKEVALREAPLVTVIAQVRFTTLLAVRSADRIIDFQDRIGEAYPHLERQDIPTTFVIGPVGPSGPIGEPQVHWRFADGTADWKWRISLTQEFLSLETRAYQSRQDFLKRLEEILRSLKATLPPKRVTRLGIRYIDQIKGTAVARIGSLLRKEVIGTADAAGDDIKQLLTELHAAADPGSLVARWGKLPAGMTIDPNLLPPLQEDTWLIDLDVSSSRESAFDADVIIDTARLGAERVYAIFRWMVTPEFLKTYGGET
jgi:uncharacterized protein (TIGR04255 family)